ncbi:MAG: hypothetical protein HKL99_10465 [Burkholderiales bacterium]|nr:hypothetical protein [Burkholderiales bacterium]
MDEINPSVAAHDAAVEPTFWRVRPPVVGRPIEFDAASGAIGILSLPIEAGVLAIVLDGTAQERDTPAGSALGIMFDAIDRMVAANFACTSGNIQWVNIGRDGILRWVSPARNVDGRTVILRTVPLRCFPESVGSTIDFAFIYGSHARLALTAGVLNFPRLVSAMIAAGSLASEGGKPRANLPGARRRSQSGTF